MRSGLQKICCDIGLWRRKVVAVKVMEQVLDQHQAVQEAAVCMAMCHPSVVGLLLRHAQAVTFVVNSPKKASEHSLEAVLGGCFHLSGRSW